MQSEDNLRRRVSFKGPTSYTKQHVSATDNGVAVNTGVHNGLMTQMKADGRPWLLTIHCFSHLIELAIKDSLLKLCHMLYSVATGNPTAVDQSFFASLNEDDERKMLDVDEGVKRNKMIEWNTTFHSPIQMRFQWN